MQNDQSKNKIKQILTNTKCPKCNMVYRDLGTSMYICQNCGYEEPTKFGIVRAYLEEHGNASALEISRDTGIPVSDINSFLRHGRLEIPESSEVFIECKKCGISIRYGKYCPGCAQELQKELQSAFDPEWIGPVPKTMQGKMHALNQLRDRK